MRLDVSAIVTVALFEFSFITRFIDWMILIIKGIPVGGIYYLVEFLGADLQTLALYYLAFEVRFMRALLSSETLA